MHATVDGIFKWRGTSVMVSGIGRSALSTRGAARARNGVGVVGQAGHFVTDGLELVARAAALGPVSPLGDASSVVVDDGLRRQLEFALGANLFFVGQGLKLQLDAGTIAPEGERPDLVARAQLQIFL